MKQQLLRFIPTPKQPIEVKGEDMYLLFMGINKEYFYFPGRVNVERRDGQFQYRWGIKVQPKDWRLHGRKTKMSNV